MTATSLGLQLAPCKVQDHLSTGNPGGPPQREEIQGTGESIRIPETQHGRDPTSSILESKACFIHFVLFNGAAMKMVYTSLGIDLWFVGTWRVGELGAG